MNSANRVRERLKADLLAAMKGRQREAVTAIRSLMSAIDNAEAVEVVEEPGPPKPPVIGPSNEVPRRELTEAKVRQILQGEADDRRAAVETYQKLGKQEEAERVHAEWEAMLRYLDDSR